MDGTSFWCFQLWLILLTLVNSPLNSCGFKENCFKTVFLLSMALGKRRSEIYDLSCSEVQFSEESVSFGTFPG